MDAGLAHLVSWCEPTKGDVPPPLTGPSITISPLPAPHPPTVFLFGGKSVQTRRLTAEMWAINLHTRVWERVDAGEGPGPRYFHSMDVWEDKLVCFGGMSDSDPMSVHNDIWLFDCLSRQWLPQSSTSGGIGLGISSPSAPQQNPSLLPSARYAHLSAISRGRLIVSGGQHSDNSWIYEINVYDLKKGIWESKTEQPELNGLHSKGAYRSVSTSSKRRVVVPHTGGELKATTTYRYSIDEEGEGGDIWCYSNYDFAKVRRELEVISPDLSIPPTPSDQYISPPSFNLRDESDRMKGHSQPPGLRFPTGGIVGNHFILCGLYLASSSAAFSIWALNFETMTWRHLEPQILGTGSWNRAVLWPETAKILIFGNNELDLASDYSRRAVNLDHVAVVSLEAYGIYQPPRLEIPAKVQQAGLAVLDEKLASDFEVICDDGRRVKCSRQILSERWPWFAEQEQVLSNNVAGVIAAAPSVDINDTLLGSFTPARLAPTNLTLCEPFPVCVALVQFFYTLSLSTPLQNRAPVLSALLFLAKQYKIDRLNKLVIHALHERLEPSIAVGIYEIATLAGEQCLQVRALNMIHSAKNAAARNHRQGPAGAQNIEGGSTAPAPQNITPTGTYPSNEGAPNSSTGPRGGPTDDVHYRRARADSFTVPTEVLVAAPAESSTTSRQLEVSEDLSEDKDDQVNALLAALDVNKVLTRKRSMTTPEPGTGYESSPSYFNPSGPVPPRRHPLRMPMPAPNPSAYRSTPLPLTPDMNPPERGMYRPTSPTESDVTSNFPSTPAESMRESWILPPPSREWTSSIYDSRASSSSGHGLPPLPESRPTDYSDEFDMRRILSARARNREFHLDHTLDGKKLSKATLEAAGLSTPPTQSFGAQQSRAMESMSNHHDLGSYYHESATPLSGLSRATSSSSVSASSPVVNRARQFSVITSDSASSSGHSAREIKLGSFPACSVTSTVDDQDSTLYRANTLASTFNDGSSISSGSTGTSSKMAAKAEQKAIKNAEKEAKKAEAQARFEALRAEQAKKMAIAKAEAQRQEDIRAKEKAEKEKQALLDKDKPKSKWGKLGKGFSEAVLFPTSGSGNQMF